MRLAGYCPICGLMVGDEEIGTNCLKCGTPMEQEWLEHNPPNPAVKQRNRDRLSGDAFSKALSQRHKRERDADGKMP